MTIDNTMTHCISRKINKSYKLKMDQLTKDARKDARNKSCVSSSWNLENDTTHGQTGSTINRSRPPADQSGKRVAS